MIELLQDLLSRLDKNGGFALLAGLGLLMLFYLFIKMFTLLHKKEDLLVKQQSESHDEVQATLNLLKQQIAVDNVERANLSNKFGNFENALKHHNENVKDLLCEKTSTLSEAQKALQEGQLVLKSNTEDINDQMKGYKISLAELRKSINSLIQTQSELNKINTGEDNE